MPPDVTAAVPLDVTAAVPPNVLALIEEQGGLVRSRQLRAAGMNAGRLRRAVRIGHLRRVARDLYSHGEPRPGEQLKAAVTRLNGVVSHQSAALLWGMELLHADVRPHVAVGRARSRAAVPGVHVHRTAMRDGDATTKDAVRVTTVVRTVFDLARSLPLDQAVAAADSALRHKLVTVPELVAALVALPAGRGRARVAKVIALVDPTSGSVLESIFRVSCAVRGVPAPVCQLSIRTPTWSGRVDFAWPAWRLIVETDGFAFHSDRDSYRRDRRRDNALQRAGWRVVRLTYEDVVHTPDDAVRLIQAFLTPAAA